MGYSVKWVNDNLGITRDTLRYYENQSLMPKNKDSKYRDYNDEDIERIWAIKLLTGIGFSAKEIGSFINDSDFDFDSAIADKVVELEKQREELEMYLEVAKNIQFSGRVPTVLKIGSMKFDDFIAYVRENWNGFYDPSWRVAVKVFNNMSSKEVDELTPREMELVKDFAKSLNLDDLQNLFLFHAYYQILSDMKDLDYKSDMVQRVVKLLHECTVQYNLDPDLDGKITKEKFARNFAVPFIGGVISKSFEKNYGKDGCVFIASAIAYYGGYSIDEI